MGQNQIVRRALKKVLVPVIEALGFQGKFPHFQRFENGDLHLLSIVFDKNGGGFFLEFTCHPPGDLETSWGEVIPERELTVAHTSFESRARLQKNGHQNSLSEDWFRFEELSKNEIDGLVRHVGSLITQVDDWLREKRVGKNISTTEP